MPSLLAFVHPLSGVAEVDVVLRRGFAPTDLEAVLAPLSDDHARLLLQHTTALIHERRHLHDTLVTPVGRALFRSAFGGAVSAVTLLKECHRRGDEVLLPLERPEGDERGLFDIIQVFAREYEKLFDSAQHVLEFSATLAQLGFCMKHAGERGFRLAVQDFQEDERYGVILEALEVAARRNAAHADRLLPAVAEYVLALLSEAPHPTGGAASHDHALGGKLMDLMRDPDGVPKLEAERDRMRRHFATNVQAADELEHRGKAKLAEYSRLLGADLGKIVTSAMDDFHARAQGATARVLQDPARYTDVGRYLSEPWPEPLLYSFADGLNLERSERSLAGEAVGPYEEVAEVDEDGKTFYGVRLRPVLLPSGGAADQMDLRAWVPFSGFAGAGMLVAQTEWEHPFSRYWRKALEKATGLRFKRRL